MTFEVSTGRRFACVDVTDQVARWLRGREDGLCHVFVPHATAGLALIEMGSGTEQDVETALADLLPRKEERWVHRHGSPGHGADHVLPVIVSSSLVIPVFGGRMALGTWQSIALIDPNTNNPTRTVRVSFLAGT
ncbi:MAG: secondary thiamine-phosphate synthase enzyme YjbQ [Egibacteraceae bacterium]